MAVRSEVSSRHTGLREELLEGFTRSDCAITKFEPLDAPEQISELNVNSQSFLSRENYIRKADSSPGLLLCTIINSARKASNDKNFPLIILFQFERNTILKCLPL